MANGNSGSPGGGVGAAVSLSLPELQPTPVEGCAVCAALAVQRREARERGDLSAATDANVRLRNHRDHVGNRP
ncbi:hypothetical protein YWIDRAFT_05881 [Streptomyces sp. SceaMP-e96]|nr:hypothetical protein DKG71_11140 [Streptomyces sp. NEAU-S7GS2]SCK32039.1 hypothetical protein YWIDRAFT_05881 [Streptomyces sp. SceaMP-e96]